MERSAFSPKNRYDRKAGTYMVPSSPQQVRIFPHSRKEFPSEEALTTWLLNGLRSRGGVYHLRDADRVADLPPGSIILFRYNDHIVGEAVVWKEKVKLDPKEKDRMISGEEAEYGAQVTFAPSSIRLYAPPLRLKEDLQPLVENKDLVTFAGAYVQLDWSIYARVLEAVVSRGTFMS
jgi:hypothetical protein